MDSINDWLLSSNPWTAYRTRLDLLGEPESAPEGQQTRAEMLSHPLVQALLAELGDWPGGILNSHKSAGHALHKLVFVADLGLRVDVPAIAEITTRVMEHQSPQGPFQMLGKISPAYGGTGEEVWGWALCDAPSLVYALAKLGLRDDPRVRAAAAYLAGLGRENGWPCAVSPEMGTWRGPGRKEDPCPYANLIMLKTLAQFADWRDSAAVHDGVNTALALWEARRNAHPYIFYMGNDFCKLKAPLVWYDLVHVLDVLTQFAWTRDDPRLRTMLDVALAKADADGKFTPESVWQAWKAWDFGQKKVPSPWLTLLMQRILKRIQ